VNPLEPPDSTYLEAAEGWLDLGNHIEANEELERIEAKNRAHPNVLQVRWRIYAKAENWEAGLDIATALTKLAPDWRCGWPQLARTLRKLNRTGEARDLLISVWQKFDRNTTFPFYLACYSCQLGLLPEARKWLDLAFSNADSEEERKQVRLRALDTPDLEPLWKNIENIGT
jgi:tetratricopeptide (TPR) repeat protein